MKTSFLKTTIFSVFFFLILNVKAQEKVVFAPHWLAQSQFVGYYVALDKGFYKAEGLDVTIKPLNLTKNNTGDLLNGKADIISMFLEEAVLMSKNNDILNICQTSQNNSLVIVGNEKIKKLSDLEDKKIGHWRGEFGLEFLKILNQKKIFASNIEYNTSGINYFISGAVDAMIAMEYNELFTALNSGLHITDDNLFYLRDLGINTPEEGLYCMTKSFQPKYLKFVKASIKGWEYAATHKEESLQIVYKYMKRDNIPIQRTLQKWMLDKVLELQKCDMKDKNSKKSFTLSQKDYMDLCNLLIKQGDIKSIKPYKAFVYNK